MNKKMTFELEDSHIKDLMLKIIYQGLVNNSHVNKIKLDYKMNSLSFEIDNKKNETPLEKLCLNLPKRIKPHPNWSVDYYIIDCFRTNSCKRRIEIVRPNYW